MVKRPNPTNGYTLSFPSNVSQRECGKKASRLSQDTTHQVTNCEHSLLLFNGVTCIIGILNVHNHSLTASSLCIGVWQSVYILILPLPLRHNVPPCSCTDFESGVVCFLLRIVALVLVLTLVSLLLPRWWISVGRIIGMGAAGAGLFVLCFCDCVVR